MITIHHFSILAPRKALGSSNVWAETDGFEPSRGFKTPTSLAVRRFRPLSHVSNFVRTEYHRCLKSSSSRKPQNWYSKGGPGNTHMGRTTCAKNRRATPLHASPTTTYARCCIGTSSRSRSDD